MLNIKSKLRLAEHLLANSPSKLLRSLQKDVRLAREDIMTQRVTTPLPKEDDQPRDAQTLLKENGDIIVTVFRSLKDSDNTKADAKRLYDTIKLSQTLLKNIGKGLLDSLGGSDEELKDLDESKIGELKTALDTLAKEQDDLLTVGSLLKTYANKSPKKSEAPVKHKSPDKDKQKSKIKEDASETKKQEEKDKEDKKPKKKDDFQSALDKMDKTMK